MVKARSPAYPAIGLKEAIDKVRMVYAKDFQNRVPKSVIASHMGYKGLNGGSLPILAALNQYGLLEGRGDETRVSDAALAMVAHDPGIAERLIAVRAAASAPELFAELNKRFPDGKGSDAAVRSYLLMSKFLPAAADTVIRSYRETIDLLSAEEIAYARYTKDTAEFSAAFHDLASKDDMEGATANPAAQGKSARKEEQTREGLRKEVITLDEGDVIITFPDNLSAESFGDLKDHLDLFVKKMQRRAAPDKH